MTPAMVSAIAEVSVLIISTDPVVAAATATGTMPE
jgi:hypothetical protein